MNRNREKAASEFGLRWRIVVDPKKETAARWFAGLELVLLPLSFVTFGYVVLDAVLSPCGVSLSACLPSAFARWVLPVLVAGAIGYVTNWLAILMLFKPYERKPWYWGWRQGLIPQNKAKIARQVGEQVCTELLPPAALVAEFTQEVQTYLSWPDVIGKVKGLALEMFGRHEKEIVDFLVPQIESATDGLLKRLMTPERIRAFWDETLAPRLKDPQTRQFMAEKVVGGDQGQRPGTRSAHPRPAVRPSAQEGGSRATCRRPWPDGRHCRLRHGLVRRRADDSPPVRRLAGQARDAGDVSRQASAAGREDFRLDEQINAQDIAHFHRMLNDLAAQHLSAIQVLGYILGVAVGLIQLAA